MIVDSVTIKLSGKLGTFRLSRLRELGYKRTLKGGFGREWYFDGVWHRYLFRSHGTKGVEIVITKAPTSEHDLIPEITFSQIESWVGKSVKQIEGQ